MKPGAKFTEELVGRVKSAISQDVGRRCVPKYVFETPEIPVSCGAETLVGSVSDESSY
jgi:acetoacetyl-CoA synthetase